MTFDLMPSPSRPLPLAEEPLSGSLPGSAPASAPDARLVDAQQDPRWASVEARDASADGQFVHSTRTTGVYCRPSCPSRRANPKNVAFHATPQEAEAAGFRACKRCRPDQADAQARLRRQIAAACALADASERPPSLAQMAQAANLSPAHFHRLFKACVGLTPKAYASARRDARAREALRSAPTATEALHDAGFGSSGRFYARAPQALGMPVASFKAGGERETIRFAVGLCSLGSVLVAQSAQGICAIFLGEDPQALADELARRFPKANLEAGDPDFDRVVAQAAALVERPASGFDLPLDIRGTAFQRRVWQALRDIPLGQTVSYAQLAERVGAPGSARAVAGACGANAIAVAIPCHRVVRTGGALCGYRWGVERKAALLRIEQGGDAPAGD